MSLLEKDLCGTFQCKTNNRALVSLKVTLVGTDLLTQRDGLYGVCPAVSWCSASSARVRFCHKVQIRSCKTQVHL